MLIWEPLRATSQISRGGLLVQRVIDAVYESSERGTSVRLDDAEHASEDERAAKLE